MNAMNDFISNEDQKAFRPCGTGWQFCAGNCTTCDLNLTTYSNTTNGEVAYTYSSAATEDSMSKPTEAQYKESKDARNNLSKWIAMSRKRQSDLLDDLFRERCLEKDYQAMYDAHKDLIRRYEIYEELESHS